MSDSEGRRLVGWKQISAHLDVTEKTARTWELTRGLPIRRGRGKKPQVVAHVDELDAWRRQDEALPAAQESASGRTGRRVLLAAVFLAVAAVVVVVLRANGTAERPAGIEIAWNQLRVLDESGRLMWAAGFDQLDDSYYEKDIIHAGNLWTLLDLDDDGYDEILFVEVTRDSTTSTALHCLRFDQELCWPAFRPQRRFPEDTRLAGAFHTSVIGLATGHDRKHLVVYGWDSPLYAACIFLLDPANGTVIQDYCHPGWFYDAKIGDLDGDGSDELIFGGVNNPGQGLGYPAVAVFSVPLAPATKAEFFRQSFGPSRYALLPRPDVADVTDVKSVAGKITLKSSGGLRIYSSNSAWYLLYDLDPELHLERLILGDSFHGAHRELQRTGELDHDADDDTSALRRIVFFDAVPDGNSEANRAAIFTRARIASGFLELP